MSSRRTTSSALSRDQSEYDDLQDESLASLNSSARAHEGDDPDALIIERLPPQRDRRQCKAFCGLTLVLIFAFVATITGAIVGWKKRADLREDTLWDKKTCFIEGKRQVARPLSPTEFRGEVDVRDYGLPDASEKVVAYFGETSDYIFDKDNVEQLLSNVYVQQRNPCWVKRTDKRRVSMVKVSPRDTGASGEKFINIAWASSFFACITGFMILALLGNAARGSLTVRTPPPYVNVSEPDEASDPASPFPKKRLLLSNQQAKFVCSMYSVLLKATDPLLNAWTCSICLEGPTDSPAEGGQICTVLLPCNHRYHKACLRRWVRRGAATCPLCNWDICTAIEDNEASSSHLETSGTPNVTPVTVSVGRIRSLSEAAAPQNLANTENYSERQAP